MRRRRGLVVTAGAAATVAAVALFRPDGGGEPADRPTTSPVTSAPHAGNRPWSSGDGGPTTSTPAGTVPPATGRPRPPHDSGGVSAVEELEPAAAAAAVGTAEAFADAWATPGRDWHDRLAAYASPSLAASLAGATPVDPVPVRVGSGAPVYATPTWARVRVATDRGDLILDLTRVGSRWLVSAVDWQRW